MIKSRGPIYNVLVFSLVLLCSACSTTGNKAPLDEDSYEKVSTTADEALTRFKESNPKLANYFQEAHGYAMYPSVVRLGFGGGFAYGNGFLYEQEKLVGQTRVWQFMYGLLMGGQLYSQIIFFKNKESLDHFKEGTFEFAGHAGIAFLNLGAAALPGYSSDVAIFARTKFGLIVELTPGGMGFNYRPIPSEDQ